jgi:seryl-tRNA(Sec) selenium transferase
MLVSLGVERLVSINGTVVASTHFSIPDMTQLSAADAQLASDTMAAVLVQNSLDQAIRTQTTINTTVANLALLKAVNFESSLRDALNSAVGK